MRVLLVEDDLEQAESLKHRLQKAGYVIEMAHNGTDGQFLGDEEMFDAVILDLGLPEISGLDVLKHWRKKGNTVPVLVLTARDAWHERVDGLNAGADDYLGKPFHADEVSARLQAIVRRTVGKADNVLEWNGVKLLLSEQQAINQQGQSIALTAIDFRLLRQFMMYPDKVHSKTQLSEQVYEEERIKDSNVIEVYVNRLRNYFGKDFIKTQWGKGYRIAPENR